MKASVWAQTGRQITDRCRNTETEIMWFRAEPSNNITINLQFTFFGPKFSHKLANYSHKLCTNPLLL